MKIQFTFTGAETIEVARPSPLNGVRLQNVTASTNLTFSLWTAPAGDIPGAAAFQSANLIAEGVAASAPASLLQARVLSLPVGHSFYCSSDIAGVATFNIS